MYVWMGRQTFSCNVFHISYAGKLTGQYWLHHFGVFILVHPLQNFISFGFISEPYERQAAPGSAAILRFLLKYLISVI